MAWPPLLPLDVLRESDTLPDTAEPALDTDDAAEEPKLSAAADVAKLTAVHATAAVTTAPAVNAARVARSEAAQTRRGWVAARGWR